MMRRRRPIRELRHCGRCHHRGHLRSPERGDRCVECEERSDGKAALMNAYRQSKPLDSVIDAPTARRFNIDLLNLEIRPRAGSTNIVVAPTEGLAECCQRYGYEISFVDIYEDRTPSISEGIDSLPGDNPSLIVFPGKSQTEAIKELIERSGQHDSYVIVLSDAADMDHWRSLGALSISGNELPQRHSRGNGNAGVPAVP